MPRFESDERPPRCPETGLGPIELRDDAVIAIRELVENASLEQIGALSHTLATISQHITKKADELQQISGNGSAPRTSSFEDGEKLGQAEGLREATDVTLYHLGQLFGFPKIDYAD